MGDVTVDKSVWDALRARVKGLDRAHVKVGVLATKGGSKVPDGGDLTLVEIAALHEFGNEDRGGYIPERSFIRSTFYVRAAQELRDMQIALAKKIVTGGMDPVRALGILGSWASNAIKKTITDGEGVPPPLKQATINAKGSSRPLVDTGLMKNSINYEVSLSSEGSEDGESV